MHSSLVSALNGPGCFLLSLLLNHIVLNFTFLITNRNELVGYRILNELSSHLMLEHIVEHTFVESILKGDVQLVVKTTPPLFLVRKVLHASHEALLQEFLRDVQTLKFVHSFHLLLPTLTGVMQNLILLFYPRNLPFHLLLPVVMGAFLPFLIFSLKLPDLFKFRLFLHFQQSLLHRFRQ